MVDLPEAVEIEAVVIDGKKVEKQKYADGSYGIKQENGSLKIYGTDKSVKTYELLSDKGTDYYLSAEKLADGTERSFSRKGLVMSEKFPDGSKKEYDVYVYETRTSRLVGAYHSGRAGRYLRTKHYLQKETLADGTVHTFYPNDQKESTLLPDGSFKKWNVRGAVLQEKSADGKVVDYKYDRNGKLNYHAVNGVEDTVAYLAKQRVAAKRINKETRLEAQTGKETILPKMNKVEKAVEMFKAKREVRKSLRD